VTDFSSDLKEKGLEVSLKVFLTTETAASHGPFDNPTLANEFIFDWLSHKLGINKARLTAQR
jgi:hypothetical protein